MAVQHENVAHSGVVERPASFAIDAFKPIILCMSSAGFVRPGRACLGCSRRDADVGDDVPQKSAIVVTLTILAGPQIASFGRPTGAISVRSQVSHHLSRL